VFYYPYDVLYRETLHITLTREEQLQTKDLDKDEVKFTDSDMS